MKTLSILSVFAAASALFVLFPVNFETTASVAFSLGFASILISDYTRRLRLVDGRKRYAPIVATRQASASPLGLAA